MSLRRGTSGNALADTETKKLQRAIAEYRGISYERLVGSPAQEGPVENARVLESGGAASTGSERGTGPAPETKRKYRRHPKPDDNAPERPPSAYVIFSNKVREEVKDQNLSFTQIAKLVGDRWQKLDPAGKEPFEAQAAAAKEKYNIQLSAYRKTDAYKEYMQYLAEFKAKHGQTSEPKRPKLDPESSGSIISAKSLEINPESVHHPSSGHVRGGSMGSVASSPFIGGTTQPSGPAPTMPQRPTLSSSRSGSPPSIQQSRDYFRAGLLSSHSSVSDESSTVRSDLPEPLMRTAGLSLGTSTAGTPPLPPFPTPTASSVESVGSPDLLARSRLAYFVQQQQQQQPQVPLPTPSISSTASGPPSMPAPFQPPLPSPGMSEGSWRPRPPEMRSSSYQETPRPFHVSMPMSSPGREQLSPSQLPPLLSPDRPPDYPPGSSSRILPPPRTPSAGTASLSHHDHPLDPLRPLLTEPLQIRQPLGRDDERPPFDRSESDAANALAGLAAGVPRSDTARPFGHPPRPPLP